MIKNFNPIIFVVLFCIILLIGGVIFLSFFSSEQKVESFDVADYYDYIVQFPSDKILGPVDSEEVAKEKAQEVWLELYGESVEEKKPYTVFFDESSETWLVKGSLPKDRIGGVPYILIEKLDGKVLAIWHSK